MSKTKSVFELNENLEAYHQTSDGTKFFREYDAKSHARGLKDKEIKRVKRKDEVSEENTDAPAKKEKKASKGKSLTPMQEAKLRAEAVDKLENVEAVKEALKDETAKSVIKAGEARIETLEKDAQNTKETNEDKK